MLGIYVKVISKLYVIFRNVKNGTMADDFFIRCVEIFKLVGVPASHRKSYSYACLELYIMTKIEPWYTTFLVDL